MQTILINRKELNLNYLFKKQRILMVFKWMLVLEALFIKPKLKKQISLGIYEEISPPYYPEKWII